jgi:hypothetical protein
MSSPLPNTLLVQRLDTLLGVSLAKYTTIARSEGNFDALLGTGRTSAVEGRPPKQQGPTPEQPAIDEGQRRTRSSSRIDSARATDTPQRSMRSSDNFPSSPTTLGPTARLVLSLLQSYPQVPVPVLRSPLAEPLSVAQLGPAGAGSTGAAAPARSNGANTTNPSTTVSPDRSPQPGAADNASTATSRSRQSAAAASPGAWPSASHPAISQLAQALARQVQTSGMFYESNLARIAFQGASPEHLQQHPQARTGSAASEPGLTAALQRDPASSPTAAPAWAQQDHATTTESARAAAGQVPAQELPAEHAIRVRQQLDVLATQQWQAQGEAWPGVALSWAIERLPNQADRAADSNDQQGEQAAADESGDSMWQTRLTLQLPHLGSVEACLQIRAQRCQLTLYSNDAADTLRQHAAALQAQFAASSVQLDGLLIAAQRPVDAAVRVDQGGPAPAAA